MDEEHDTDSQLKSQKIQLRTKEDVAKKLKEWMEIGTDSDVSTNKLYGDAIKHIEWILDRQLSFLETTWTERQYVITLLKLWLKNSLEKVDKYLNDAEENDVSQLSTVLSQLNSINSLEDIRSIQLNGVEWPLFNWCDGDCRYFQLILEQEDLFKNTSRFTAFVSCYFKQFKTSCIEKVFSRCLNDIVTDTTNGEKHGKLIESLNEFLGNVDEDKNLKEILDKEEFLIHYVEDENKTGQDIIKQLMEKFGCSSATEQGETIETRPEWLQTFLKNANSISDDEWTPKLKLLTKEICKKFLLPKTEINFKEENGKQIIQIEGITIFVSKVINKMIDLKIQHRGVEEMKIIALKSVHIDCDLDSGIWHGINIGIVTDKLVVDDKVCWDVSGEKAKDQSMGKRGESGESGGNVHVFCNQIINGEKWTIVSDGGDGSDGKKWTKEEFEKSFPSMSTDEANIQTVLTTLQEILPKEKRTEGIDVSPEHTGNFMVWGSLEDGSKIIVIFYKGKKTKQTLISIQGGRVGQGGYGGDIAMEFFGNDEMNPTPGEVPFTGSKNPTSLTAVRCGFYEALGSNGNIGEVTGDVAFIQKNTDASSGGFYGFETDEVIRIQLFLKNVKPNDTYVKYKDAGNEKWYAVFKKPYESYWGGTIVSAIKKKSVIRQSLVRHFNPINEWNRLTETIQIMTSNLKERHSNNIEEIVNEMENKVRQFHQFMMTQQQRQKHQTLEKKQYVKPTKVSSSHSVVKPEIIGRRPAGSQLLLKQSNEENIFCLDVLPTEDGNDSLLHCIFGQVNSNGKYECNYPDKVMKQIAKYIREKGFDRETYNAVILFVLRVKDDERFLTAKTEGKVFIDFIMEKHPQLKGTETQILSWLNQNDDENDPKEIKTIIEVWKSIWKRDFKIIKDELKEEDENCGKYKILKEEYAKYIESSFGHRTIPGLLDLQILANTFLFKIHVFEDHVSSSTFQHKETTKLPNYGRFKTPAREEHFILYEGKGRWKKLEPNRNLNWFCKDFFTREANDNKNEKYFETLKTWIDGNQEITNKNCIDKFNPKCNKTPDKLSQLVLDWIKPNMGIDETKQLVQAMSLLAKWVDYYNTRNVSPFFYLTIVKKFQHPREIEREFLVLEMETRLSKSKWWGKGNSESWRKRVRGTLETHDQALLSLLTQITMRTKENDILFSFDLMKILQMMNVSKQIEIERSFLDKKDVDSISVINFYYKNRGAFWVGKVDDWLLDKTDNQLNEENKPEYVNLLLQLEYKNKQKLLQNFTKNSAEAIGYLVRKTRLAGEQKCKQEPRTVEDIIKEMKRTDVENHRIKNEIEEMVNQSNIKKIQLENCVESIVNGLIKKNQEKNQKYRIFLKEERHNQTLGKTYGIKNIDKLFKNILEKGNQSQDECQICCEIKNSIYDRQIENTMTPEYFLCVFDFAVQLTMGFELRDTQKVTLMTLLERDDTIHKINTLAQVKTGEGKSIIVAGLAIGYALKNKRKKHNSVDVITSNDVLAIRDSSFSVAEGGLKELYEFFNVTVSNNCSQSVNECQKAYNMDVVYGQLANFQRDYLLDTFYNRNIRGDRSMINVIIDEADCMLLDRGSNVLYLSHDIPGMEMLESLYVFIWEKIQKLQKVQAIITDKELELIKSAILYDLYGQISRENLKNIQNNLLTQEESASERTELWEHLIKKKVIDPKGRLLINDVNEITENKMKYSVNTGINSKLKFYFRKIAERERRIHIPNHLLDFVDRQLDTWLDNARRALELKQDEDYVIDCDRSDTSPDLNPQVIIIDPETGTDQFHSQWDGALHQFLQLKEGCKLTMQSLKAIFISNANYIKGYGRISGVSGTLGSRQGKTFLRSTYKCDFFTIPTAFTKTFRLKPPKLLKTKEIWLTAITKETQRTIVDENRSIVIFCQSIKQVNKVHQHLKSKIPDLIRDLNNKRIHRYTRDYEKFPFEKEPGLDVGNVIVATNLAGRGTDIKLSETLKENGGLHICLTYFPENERVEEQAMGRAARKGEPGSRILILCESQTVEESRADEEWGLEKIFVMKEERAWKERQRISRLEKDFEHTEIFKLDRFVLSEKSVTEKIKIIKKEKTIENTIVQLLDDGMLLKFVQSEKLDKWALWLDESDFNLKSLNLKLFTFEKINLDDITSAEFFTSLTPARRIAIAKCLATTKYKLQIDQKEKATNILKEFIHSPDNFFYPSAFYYYAFILLTKSDLGKDKFKKEKEKFIRTLRNAETILNEHIDMQISFIQIHQSERKLASSFYTVDGYKEQKQNNIEILEYFLRSIQWMLGSQCSILNLQKAGSEAPKIPRFLAKTVEAIENYVENKTKKKSAELKNHKIRSNKVDEYFGQLLKSKCIGCEFNETDTIPNVTSAIDKSTTSSKQTRSAIILQIADDYGVSSSLEEKLSPIFRKALNEEEIEKKLKKKIQIPCTRKAFWLKLKEIRDLMIPLKECLKTDCVIISEKHTVELEQTFKFDRKQAITLEFGVKSFDKTKSRLCVLYNPTYDNQQELEKAKKMMFCKKYVQTKLSIDGYRKWKEHFESNKIAQIDLGKFQKFESISQLGTEDFNQINIDQSEHQGIWDQLVEQKIINNDGYLEPNYDFKKNFNYPDCPAYAEAVMRLVSKKFVFELVIQQWLKFKENPNCLKAINLLPLKPYRDMLADLMAAHVISGTRVTENFAIDFKQEINKITEYDQERKCLMEYLTSHQSVLTAKPIAPEFVLDFIERDIHFASELYIFRLVGFDCVIDIKDREWTAKRKLLVSLFAPLIVTGGLASIGVGGFLTYSSILSFGFSKNLFFMGGFSDILYAVETILSRKKFTWADYGRQRIRSAIGKIEPIDAIKAIWKLRGSSNQSFRDTTVTNQHPWNKRTDQNQVNTIE